MSDKGLKKRSARIFSAVLFAGLVLVVSPQAYATGPATKAVPDKAIVNPQKEFESILRQREELRAREAGLKQLERIVDEKTKKLERLLSEIKNESETLNKVSDARIRRLIKLYSSMDAKSAARLMEGLDTDQAIEVLAGMKGEISGPILSSMEHDRATQLIKLLASYKGPKGAGG